MPAITHISLVRHGETDWNASRRLQGHIDIPLNNNGLEQAAQLAVAFSQRQFRFDAMYSSDLLRAHQTAIPLATVLALPLTTDAALRERHMGVLQGLTGDEAAVQQADHWHDFKNSTPGKDLAGGECPQTFRQRVQDAISELASQHPGQHILLVTHGGVLDMVYRIAKDMPLDGARSVAFPNAALNRIKVSSQGWEVEQWADTSHLTRESLDEVATG